MKEQAFFAFITVSKRIQISEPLRVHAYAHARTLALTRGLLAFLDHNRALAVGWACFVRFRESSPWGLESSRKWRALASVFARILGRSAESHLVAF